MSGNVLKAGRQAGSTSRALRTLGPIVLAALLLAACAPAASQPKPAAATQAAKPTSAPAGGAAASTAEWDRVLAAAKQEGKVVVAGPIGTPARDALTDPFQQKYGI